MPLIDPSDPRPIHFMGIAGAGMNGLAELALRQGAQVTGCDSNLSGHERLVELGAKVYKTHSPRHVAGARALVVSSAISKKDPEVKRAIKLGIPVVRRAEALAELVSGGRVVAIAGTHGKTTTTVLTSLALQSAGQAPTGVVGGRVREWGGNLMPGGKDLFVVEADEYDRSFLALSPAIAVITNIEADHMDIYSDIADIRAAFRQFAEGARSIVLCADDDGACTLATPPGARRVLYGVRQSDSLADERSRQCDIEARDVVFSGAGSKFGVWRPRVNKLLGVVRLGVPGMHNVRNALAAIAASIEAGAEFSTIVGGIESFRGVERRFEIVGEARGVAVVDDYAHHPTEIAATIAAARSVYPGRRLVAVFQPHLFSRTRDFAGDFGRVLASADSVLLTEIYAAREEPISNVDSGLIAAALLNAGGTLAWRGEVSAASDALIQLAADGDVVVTLGAGDITSVGRQFLAALKARR